MSVFKIEKVSQRLEYCLVEGDGTVDTYELTTGRPLLQAPEDFRETQLSLSEDEFGLELTDLLGSTNQLLMLEQAVYQELAAQLRFDPIETHRFRLLNERGRAHSDDYLIVNPLQPQPCISMEHSDLLIKEDGSKIIRVRNLVLEAAKVPPLDLFRVAEDPMEHLVSQRFVDVVTNAGYTNFTFEKIRLV